MKFKLLTFSVMSLMSTGCDSDRQPLESLPTDSFAENQSSGEYSQPIPIDTANKMIQSYLTSIQPEVNSFELKSLIFDANLLRDYLNDSSNGRIENLKMVMAHRLSYINSGHFGQRPDSNSEAITIVLVGYGNDGDYIYYGEDEVLNVCQPCPRECPEVGTAASDLLPN